jgi:hypothetical protein
MFQAFLLIYIADKSVSDLRTRGACKLEDHVFPMQRLLLPKQFHGQHFVALNCSSKSLFTEMLFIAFISKALHSILGTTVSKRTP